MICLFLKGFSQVNNFHFKKLTNADGLSQSSITAITQDRFGQIWIGTRDGLNKYDGNHFTVYRNEADNDASISNNDILAIEEDADGNIWIGTFNGINKYDPKVNVFKRYYQNEEGSSQNRNNVLTIKKLSNGEIWIGTSNGLSVYDKSTDTFKTIVEVDRPNSLLTNSVSSIFETQNGTVYIGTSRGVSQLIDHNTMDFKTIDATRGKYIQDLIESPEHQLLIATRTESVLKYHPVSGKLESYFKPEH